MTYTPPTVNYSATANGTYTTLTGVQSVVINRGKRYFQDPYAPSTCLIELIPADSYALPLELGQFVDVRVANNATSPCYFSGRITDVDRQYEMPYNSVSGAAPGDRITITVTGALGPVGGGQASFFNVAAGTLVSQELQDIGFFTAEVVAVSNGSKTGGQNFTGSYLDLFNTLLRTGQMVVDDLDKRRSTDPGDFLSNYTYPIGTNFSLGIAYGDTGAGQRFKQIEYLSSVQNTFTRVQVVAPVATATASTVSTFQNTLVYNTLNETAGDVTSLANYLRDTLSQQLTPVPFMIETDTTVSANCVSVAVCGTFANLQTAIGQNAQIVFRGTTVTATIQGFTVRFGLDRASVQLYFSPSLGTPFILDSSTFGVLDTNRLGYP